MLLLVKTYYKLLHTASALLLPIHDFPRAGDAPTKIHVDAFVVMVTRTAVLNQSVSSPFVLLHVLKCHEGDKIHRFSIQMWREEHHLTEIHSSLFLFLLVDKKALHISDVWTGVPETERVGGKKENLNLTRSRSGFIRDLLYSHIIRTASIGGFSSFCVCVCVRSDSPRVQNHSCFGCRRVEQNQPVFSVVLCETKSLSDGY